MRRRGLQQKYLSREVANHLRGGAGAVRPELLGAGFFPNEVID